MIMTSGELDFNPLAGSDALTPTHPAFVDPMTAIEIAQSERDDAQLAREISEPDKKAVQKYREDLEDIDTIFTQVDIVRSVSNLDLVMEFFERIRHSIVHPREADNIPGLWDRKLRWYVDGRNRYEFKHEYFREEDEWAEGTRSMCFGDKETLMALLQTARAVSFDGKTNESPTGWYSTRNPLAWVIGSTRLDDERSRYLVALEERHMRRASWGRTLNNGNQPHVALDGWMSPLDHKNRSYGLNLEYTHREIAEHKLDAGIYSLRNVIDAVMFNSRLITVWNVEGPRDIGTPTVLNQDFLDIWDKENHKFKISPADLYPILNRSGVINIDLSNPNNGPAHLTDVDFVTMGVTDELGVIAQHFKTEEHLVEVIDDHAHVRNLLRHYAAIKFKEMGISYDIPESYSMPPEPFTEKDWAKIAKLYGPAALQN